MTKQDNIREYYCKKYVSKKISEQTLQKRKTDIIFKLIDNLRKRAFIYIKSIDGDHRKILGCDPDEFKKYLESKFIEGMNFKNYGEWELDHIKPLSKYDLTKETEIKECFHYLNIQPLWMSENRKKHNKY